MATLARERFGVAYLQPYQRLVIANIMDAAAPQILTEDRARVEEEGPLRQAVLLPTGFGKSLCFQLPALLLSRPTVVVYPLLALMADQKRRLDSLGIPSALFRGGQDAAERRASEALVESGEAKIVISNPECLAQERLLRFLASLRPSHVAIDEAHCVSEWGETFRPSYLELGRIVEALSPPALSAFTATASPSVLEAVARILFGGFSYRVIESDPDRPNLQYAVERSLCPEHTLTRLAATLPRPLVVFCASREGTQILARLLRDRLAGCDARFYHAGLERSEKKSLEEWFYPSRDGILVATCAYGMGVDKKDIRSIVHYGPPGSVEAYLQEAGRAGRDGLPARAVLVVSERERPDRAPGADLRDARRRAFLDYAWSSSGCRREGLLGLLRSGPRQAGQTGDGTPTPDRTAEGPSRRSEGNTTPCSGCDRCDGTAREAPEGAAKIVAFAAANPRRFRAEDATRILAGQDSPGAPPRCAGWGSFGKWDGNDIAAALRAATELGLVRVRASRPWKGRLEPEVFDDPRGGPASSDGDTQSRRGVRWPRPGTCLRR